MYTYSIMILDTDHADEICADIKNQYENNIASMPLFLTKLVPEGNPPADKAKMYCKKYMVFKEKLDKMNIKSGILVQCSMGHSYKLDDEIPFTHYLSVKNETEEEVCCPYDENFRKYFKDAMVQIAKCSPEVIMLDDDFRLLERPGRGCVCDLHLKHFNQMANTNLSRSQLVSILKNPLTENDFRLTDVFKEVTNDSLVGAAKAMREGIDSVNENISGIVCTVNHEPYGDIARAFAGKNNPVIIRINNGNYTPAGARNLSLSAYRAAEQISFSENKADIYLAETDTCPQNRYSTPAMSLHSHFCVSVLEGTAGAKHWITRTNSFEPESGKAYRKILSKYSAFYEKLSEIVPSLKWLGCRIPLRDHINYDFHASAYAPYQNGWVNCVLERLGLPMYFSKDSGGAVFLDGDADKYMTDKSLKDIFSGAVFMSGETAGRLNKRGFIKYTGVEVLSYEGERISGEFIYDSKNSVSAQKNAHMLRAISEDVKISSVNYHLCGGFEKKPLSPAVTVFKNPLGGTSVVFCGTPETEFNYLEAFSFLNESRKKQLTDILYKTNNLSVYYPGDAEVYLKAAQMPDGGTFVSFINIGLDPIEKITLVSDKDFTKTEKLTADGKTASVSFTKDKNLYTLNEKANTLEPVILFLS